jgi:hypothetical protein
VAVLAGIAVVMTVGVYGLVAGIVKLDDGGLHLSMKGGEGPWAAFQRAAGRAILAAAPWFMRRSSVSGHVPRGQGISPACQGRGWIHGAYLRSSVGMVGGPRSRDADRAQPWLALPPGPCAGRVSFSGG